MLTIPRTDFKAAIEVGIENSPTLLESERARLRALGDTELGVGTSYTRRCPATLAGLCSGGNIPRAATAFAWSYDDYLIDAYPDKYAFVKYVRIV